MRTHRSLSGARRNIDKGPPVVTFHRVRIRGFLPVTGLENRIQQPARQDHDAFLFRILGKERLAGLLVLLCRLGRDRRPLLSHCDLILAYGLTELFISQKRFPPCIGVLHALDHEVQVDLDTRCLILPVILTPIA